MKRSTDALQNTTKTLNLVFCCNGDRDKRVKMYNYQWKFWKKKLFG